MPTPTGHQRKPRTVDGRFGDAHRANLSRLVCGRRGRVLPPPISERRTVRGEPDVKDPTTREETAGGLVGKLAGKVKAAVGSVIGHDDLAREGHLQHAQSDAERDARGAAADARQRQAEVELEAATTDNELERDRVQAEVARKDAETRIDQERERAQQQVDVQAQREQVAAEGERRIETARATASERQASAQKRAEDDAATRLEQAALAADAKADVLDPKED
jgi:uncharacterized protein YjbJ (UPF0337 family)